MKPFIFKDWQGDWEFRCIIHAEGITTYSWQAALEAAYGHLCVHHHRINYKEKHHA